MFTQRVPLKRYDTLSLASSAHLPVSILSSHFPSSHAAITSGPINLSQPPIPQQIQQCSEFMDFNTLLSGVMFSPHNVSSSATPISILRRELYTSFTSYLDAWNTYFYTIVAYNSLRASARTAGLSTYYVHG